MGLDSLQLIEAPIQLLDGVGGQAGVGLLALRQGNARRIGGAGSRRGLCGPPGSWLINTRFSTHTHTRAHTHTEGV